MNYIPGFSNYLQASVPRYAIGGRVNEGEPLIDDMEFSDYGLGGPMMGEETVGFDLANPMLGGPEQGGSYTGGMGGGDSRTAAERLQAILDVNPYVAPTEGMNLDPITSRGQTGYYFANELGLPARYGDVGSPKPADPATYDPNAKYIEPMPGFVPVDPNATYRLVNGGTDGSVVYAGAGEEGLRNVFQQANQLTMDNPKNAYWGVEVLNPATGKYDRVAENQGPNGLGIVGDIAGVALPIAAAIATGGASLGVQIAAGAAAGGLGGFLAGKDPLTSALIGGASAGIGNVSGLNKAIGGALGKAGGALGLGGVAADGAVSGLTNAVGGEVGEQIVVTGLSKAAQAAINAAASAAGNTALSQGLKSGLSEVTGYKTPAEKFAQQPSPIAEPLAPYDGINVIANRAVAPVPNYGGALSGVFEPIATDFLPKGGLPEPLPSEPTPAAEPAKYDPINYGDVEPIVVTGGGSTTGLEGLANLGAGVTASLPALGGLAMDPFLSQPTPTQQPTTAEPDDIVVEARRPVQTVTPDAPFSAVLPTLPDLIPPLSDPTLMQPEELPDDIVVNAPQAVTRPIDIPVTSILATLPLTGLPTPDPALTNSGGNKLGAEEYLRIAGLISGLVGGGGGGSGQTGTYGGGGTGRLNPIFSAKLPSAGGLGTIGATRTARPLGDQDWLTYGTRPELNFFDYAARNNPAPITTPIPNNPAGPIMTERDPMQFAKGGRSTFAVNGPGTGRSDDIPAVLSDGEYVIDAETVALLGDGSNKAGAKKLDDLRVKVRKHKGQKLAKGRFSANAKKPEAYLSGGRI